jgi:hypothetical protein
MNTLLPIAQLIYSSWILTDDSGSRNIPTGTPGALDYALRDVVRAGDLPEWASSSLHFVATNSGLVCLELAQIQKLATEAKLTSDPNPSYTRSHFEVSPLLARRCLSRLGITEEKATTIGKNLRSAVAQAEQQLGEQAAVA